MDYSSSNSNSGGENLRSILRSADRGISGMMKDNSKHHQTAVDDVELSELVSLISSLDATYRGPNAVDPEVKRPTKQQPSSDHLPDNNNNNDNASQVSYSSSLSNRWKDSTIDLDDSSIHSSNLDITSQDLNRDRAAAGSSTDVSDFSVLRFGRSYMLRGKLGRYLTAVPEDSIPSNSPTTSSVSRIYPLGVMGQGVGSGLDCITFVNIENKEDTSPIQYGMVLAIKVPSAKERLLGLREGSRLGFWRNLVGQGEKWQLLKASSSTANRGYDGGIANQLHLSGRWSCEESGSRGRYVRLGDNVLVQTYKSDHLLSLSETLHAAEPKLVYRDRAILGAEVWQVEQFDSIGLPSWYHSRPYLNGQFLVLPTAAKDPTADAKSRTFPQSFAILAQEHKQTSSASVEYGNGSTDDGIVTPPPLHSFSLSIQHHLLMRDLLLVLSGIEGQYIRLAAASSATAPPLARDSISLLHAASPFKTSRTVPGMKAYSSVKPPSTVLELPKLADVVFVIDLDIADRSTSNQISALLPLCESAAHVRAFIRRRGQYEYGLCSQALSCSLKLILRELDVLVAQLEHKHSSAMGELTLQKLVYLLQPSRITLQLLEKLCMRVGDCIGGAMIDVLHQCLMEQGDAKARELHLHLLTSAAEPFLAALSTWMCRGVLHDPYGEFMVVEDKSLTKEALEDDFNARYWENRFTMRDLHVPAILRAYAAKALVTGKYLSVVRDCQSDNHYHHNHHKLQNNSQYSEPLLNYSSTYDANKMVSSIVDRQDLVLPQLRKLDLSLELKESSLASSIEEAYNISSRSILKLLDSRGLRSHLQSMRRFFLLEHGDFFTQFMDTAEDELRREASDVVLSRVQGLLQTAIQTSTLLHDPHKEELSCTLASHNLIQHLHLIQSAGEDSIDAYSSLTSQGLKGIEAFTLDYKIGWPLSIVLSRRSITKYQLLSRLLYFSKHVERRVLISWMTHQNTKELNVRASMGPSYCLRHRMLHFLQNFVYYMTLEVIGPRGHELEAKLDEAEDMDVVLDLHERFLDACLKECLLASQDLLKILTKIMTTCLLFADHMQRFSLENSRSSVHLLDINKSYRSVKTKDTTTVSTGATNTLKPTDKAVIELTKVLQLRKARIQESRNFITSETSHESFIRILNKFSDTFDEQLKEFLDKLWTNNYRHHVQLTNLCVRLDYNGFYSSQFAENF